MVMLMLALIGCAESADFPQDALPSITVDASASQDANLPRAVIAVDKAGDGLGTVTSDRPGIDCGSSCAAEFTEGSVVLWAHAAPGSEFDGWSGACAGQGECTLAVDPEIAQLSIVSAKFTRLRGLVQVSLTGTGLGVVQGGTIDCGSSCTASLVTGTALELVAMPSPGSIFTGWTGCAPSGDTCQLTIGEEPLEVSASFTGCLAPTASGPRFVDSVLGQDDEVHGGQSGLCAYRTIRYALAHAPEQIQLAPGTYPIVPGDVPPYVLTGRQILIGDPDDVSAVKLTDGGSALSFKLVSLAGARNGVQHCTFDALNANTVYAVSLDSRPALSTEPHFVERNVFVQLGLLSRFGGVRILENELIDSRIDWATYGSIASYPPSQLLGNVFSGAQADGIQCAPQPDPALTGSGNTRNGGPIFCNGCAACPYE